MRAVARGRSAVLAGAKERVFDSASRPAFGGKKNRRDATLRGTTNLLHGKAHGLNED
jgi:hypothetical protein